MLCTICCYEQLVNVSGFLQAALISAAVEQGFQPHHAEPAYFMLTR